MDQGLIAQLKEQYRKERKGKKGVKSKSSSALLASSFRDSKEPGPNVFLSDKR